MGHVTEYGPAKTGEYPSNIYRVPFKRSYVLRETFKLYTVCSSKLTVFPFSEQIMSRDKHSSMFSCQKEALVDLCTLYNAFTGWETTFHIYSLSLGIPALKLDHPQAFISDKLCKIKMSHLRTHARNPGLVFNLEPSIQFPIHLESHMFTVLV